MSRGPTLQHSKRLKPETTAEKNLRFQILNYMYVFKLIKWIRAFNDGHGNAYEEKLS